MSGAAAETSWGDPMGFLGVMEVPRQVRPSRAAGQCVPQSCQTSWPRGLPRPWPFQIWFKSYTKPRNNFPSPPTGVTSSNADPALPFPMPGQYPFAVYLLY